LAAAAALPAARSPPRRGSFVGVLTMIALGPQPRDFRDGIGGGVSSSVCGTLLARADEVIERSGQLFEPRLIDNPSEVGFGASTSFQAQAAHFRFSPIPDISLRRVARRPNRLTRDRRGAWWRTLRSCRSRCKPVRVGGTRRL
jgi:hypothetical protein